MAIPVKQKYTAYRGITFLEHVYAQDGLEEPLDFTGWEARMELRVDYGSDVIATPTVTINRAMITMELSAAETLALDVGSYRYDLEVEAPNGRVFQLLYGTIRVKDSITE